jgi:hypothetical protein
MSTHYWGKSRSAFDPRKTPPADARGLTRFDRGRNDFKAAAAGQQKVAFHWRLATVPGVGHPGAKLSGPAAWELLAPAM